MLNLKQNRTEKIAIKFIVITVLMAREMAMMCDQR